MARMANVSFEADDDVVRDFDLRISELKVAGELESNVTRSEVLRRLVREFAYERDDVPE